MSTEHKAQREPIEIPPEYREAVERVSRAYAMEDETAPVTKRQFNQLQHGRGFGKTARQRAAGGLLQVERPVAPSSRSKPAQRLLRANAETTNRPIDAGLISGIVFSWIISAPAVWLVIGAVLLLISCVRIARHVRG